MLKCGDMMSPLNTQFKSPSAEYRPMPLWAWNGEVSEARILEMLDQFAANGMGGVFIHPRPGLITEYLSERWFELWGFALRECKKRGLECHLYDENSFPSGFAGGHTVEADPGAAIRGLEPDGKGVKWTQGKIDSWSGYRPLAGLTRKASAETFLRVTHERYIERFGADAGGTWKYCFTDEPTLRCGDGLYATPDFLETFQREHGHEFLDKLEDYLSGDPSRAWPVRFDYWSTANRLFTNHFARTMYEWCDAHGLQFTGHVDEHEWPSPLSMPDAMAVQRWMQAPGIDLLGFHFSSRDSKANALYLMTVKELVSTARQMDRERILCECYGGGGYGYTPDDAKAMSVFLLAHGVNLINPHLSFQTLAGARKYDWPQTFSDHSPWWPFYKTLADHDARAAFLMSQSKPCSRVLVLHPTLTGWLHAVPKAFMVARKLGREKEITDRLRQSHAAFIQEMADRGLDFDLGDEFIMAELGRVQNGKLAVGEALYDAVVLPDGMETMLDETCTLLEKFLCAGGPVIAAGPAPATVRGRPDDRPARLAGQKTWIRVTSIDELAQELDRTVPPDTFGFAGLTMQMRRLVDGRKLFILANPGPSEIQGTAGVRECKALEAWNPDTGECAGMEVRQRNGFAESFVILPPRTLLFWMESDPSPAAARAPVARPEPAVLGQPAMERLSSNPFVLHTCTLRVAGQEHRNISTVQANSLMWQAHGFPQDPWEWTIQFKREYADRTFSPDSGYEVEYGFYVDPSVSQTVLDGITLAVERPRLYTITINGRAVDASAGVRWFDESMRRIPVAGLVRTGENRLCLAAHPLTIHAEIAPCYLLGDFAVGSGPDGVQIERAGPLRMGSWHTQGLLFYPWAVRYTWPVTISRPAKTLTVELGEWKGSVVRVMVDGEEDGTIFARPWRLEINRYLAAGTRELALDVYGNLKNFLGPFFHRGLPIPWSWQHNHPSRSFPQNHCADVYGLLSPPSVTCR